MSREPGIQCDIRLGGLYCRVEKADSGSRAAGSASPQPKNQEVAIRWKPGEISASPAIGPFDCFRVDFIGPRRFSARVFDQQVPR